MKEAPNYKQNLKELGSNNATYRSVYVSTIKQSTSLLTRFYNQGTQYRLDIFIVINGLVKRSYGRLAIDFTRVFISKNPENTGTSRMFKSFKKA
jgi:hypothetical protein